MYQNDKFHEIHVKPFINRGSLPTGGAEDRKPECAILPLASAKAIYGGRGPETIEKEKLRGRKARTRGGPEGGHPSASPSPPVHRVIIRRC